MKRQLPFRPHAPMHSSVLHPLSPAYPPSGDSLRVRWVLGALSPLCTASSQRLGAFAISPPPGVHGFPVLRLLCPIRLCVRALAFRWGLPCLLPTRLDIPHEVSRVQCRRRKRHGVGGVLLAAPSALCGSPVHLQGQAGSPVGPLQGNALLWPLLWRRSNHCGRDWLASPTREARGAFSRRALPASGDAPCHASATRHLVGALLPRRAPCRSMLLTS